MARISRRIINSPVPALGPLASQMPASPLNMGSTLVDPRHCRRLPFSASSGMSQIDHELARCKWWIADFEVRIAEQKLRLRCEGNVGSAEVLELMVQTLESWRERERSA